MPIIIDKDNEYGFKVIGDGGEDATRGVFSVQTGSNTVPAFTVGRTVAGNASQGAFKFLSVSNASGAVMSFAPGSFVSVTSVILTTVANIDYVIPVEMNGEARYIPVIKAAGINGVAV